MALFLILTKEDFTYLAEAQDFISTPRSFGQRHNLTQGQMFKQEFILKTYKCLSTLAKEIKVLIFSLPVEYIECYFSLFKINHSQVGSGGEARVRSWASWLA